MQVKIPVTDTAYNLFYDYGTVRKGWTQVTVLDNEQFEHLTTNMRITEFVEGITGYRYRLNHDYLVTTSDYREAS